MNKNSKAEYFFMNKNVAYFKYYYVENVYTNSLPILTNRSSGKTRFKCLLAFFPSFFYYVILLKHLLSTSFLLHKLWIHYIYEI